jgi:hypothetical protein
VPAHEAVQSATFHPSKHSRSGAARRYFPIAATVQWVSLAHHHGSLYNGWSILLDRHSSKFEYDKFLAVESLSALPKNYRSRAIEFDCDGGKNHER